MRNHTCSHEIDEKGFHEKLCSSDRSGQPDITPSTQLKNNMLLTNIVKLRHSTRTTSSIVQSTRRTLTSTFQAYSILQ